jgi:large subunit ribosomal protein L9e
MLYIYSQEQLEIPENVKIHIRSRVVTVEGPRGRLSSLQSAHRCLHKSNPPTGQLPRWRYSSHWYSRSLTTRSSPGKLTKDLSHLAVCFSLPKKNIVTIEIHHGSRKNVATLRTVKSIIQNLITGVTKGYKYKMRYVYAHFPINVNIEKNKETGLYEVEIRYGN